MRKTQPLVATVLLSALAVSLAIMPFTSVPAFAQQNPEAVSTYNQAIDAYNQGNANKALSLFEKATSLDANYADAYYNIGSIYYQKAQYPRAEAAFRKAVTLMPNDGQAKYNLAMALEKLNKPQDAIRYYQQVPTTDRKYAQARKKIELINQQLAQAVMPTTNPMPANPGQLNNQLMQDEQRLAEMARQQQVATQPVMPISIDYSKLSVKPFSKGFFGPTGMTIGPGGYLFVANYSKNAVYKVSATGDKTVFASSESLGGPIGLTFNPKTQDMYVANYSKNSVARISPKGDVTVIATGLSKPYNLFLDTYNNVLYVSEQETNAVSKIELPVR